MDLNICNVSKSYGERQVLKNFSCTVKCGSICGIMAPSGAGKTTLLRLVLGLEKPDSGEISGIPAKKAAVFQEDCLCPGLSARVNLRMALPKCPDAAIRDILTELGLGDSMDIPAVQLSGGMARRAALARALLHDGNLLTLDEPFTGLDEASRLSAANAILAHRNGRTLLLVTHRREDLELFNAEQCICLK